jgi:hypothetical protein
MIAALTYRIQSGFGHFQGDEHSYRVFALEVLDGTLPPADWSPGYAAIYAVFQAISTSPEWAQLALKLVASLVVITALWKAVSQVTSPTIAWLTCIVFAAHPMIASGQSIQLVYASMAALLLMAATRPIGSANWVFVVLAVAIWIRMEFLIPVVIISLLYVLFANFRMSRISKFTLGLSSTLLVAFVAYYYWGPIASNAPGGRLLFAFGAAYGLSTPPISGVEIWENWYAYVQRGFGNVHSPWEAAKSNPTEYFRFISHNITTGIEQLARTVRLGDRFLLAPTLGIPALISATLGGIYIAGGSGMRKRFPLLTPVLFGLFAVSGPYIVIGHQQSNIDNFVVPILFTGAIGAFHVKQKLQLRVALNNLHPTSQ